jgi:hypothetical protein
MPLNAKNSCLLMKNVLSPDFFEKDIGKPTSVRVISPIVTIIKIRMMSHISAVKER